MNKKDIVVVIPVYLPTLSFLEALSLEKCLKILSEYSIVIIKPRSLDLAKIKSLYSLPEVLDFPDECFSCLRSYNRMVLDNAFYHFFSNYVYMLIYQLDAYVFKDELLFWANQGYDYIGAPWIPWKKKHLKKTFRFYLYLQRGFWRYFDRKKLYQERYYWYQVGNGGFSLRRISKMIEITGKYEREIKILMKDDMPFLPEDIFLLWNLRRKKDKLKKPSFDIAMKFAVEHNPSWAYTKNGHQLPFGCHNWSHKYLLPFWSKFIENKSSY